MDDSFVIGLDIGGTFTDGSAVGFPSGRVISAKSPTTPRDLATGLTNVLRLLATDLGLTLEQILSRTVRLAHASTITTNVIFTWSGTRTGLITTKGFRDELLIMRARGRVAGLSLSDRRHFRKTSKPPWIVPPELIVEVAERVDSNGNVLMPLRPEDAEIAVDRLLAEGVEAIAVNLLFSPRNPSHELMLERIIRERAPRIHVSVSHKLAPVLGEYERSSTAAMNAYVAREVERYLSAVEAHLQASGLRHPLMVIQGDGGATLAKSATPVRTIESGPAAGVVAAKELALATGEPNVIATDVGGTTFKVGLIVNYDSGVARETVINQYTLAIPMLDLSSIGAGGGSIAWVDEGRLRIGPQSAGAEPGPACYGWGGTHPTVTDADLLLGFIGSEHFLSGRLRLDTDLARAALKRFVADPLFDGDVVEAAAAVRQIVDAQMADLVRKVTLERGHDPRRFALIAYGGAGPVHAAAYARGLGIRRVLIPHAATVFSALGAAMSDVRVSPEMPIEGDATSLGVVEEYFTDLERRTTAEIESFGVAGEIRLERWGEMRYARQLHPVRVPLTGVPITDSAYTDAFEARYRSLYGDESIIPDAVWRLLRTGVDGTGVVEKPDRYQLPSGEPTVADDLLFERRKVYWPETKAWADTPVWDGSRIRAYNEFVGPAIVEAPGTSMTIPPGATATVDLMGNIVIGLEA